MSQQTISISAQDPNAGIPAFFPLNSGQDIFMSWPGIAQYLNGKKKGLGALYTPAELINLLTSTPLAVLWVAWEAGIEGLMLVRICEELDEKYIYIEAANCDNLSKYLGFSKVFEQWAVMAGAKSIRFECPHPLARLLRSRGYSQPTAMVRKRIQPLWS